MEYAFKIKNIIYNTIDPDLFLKLRKNKVSPSFIKNDDIRNQYEEYRKTHHCCHICKNIFYSTEIKPGYTCFCDNCKITKNQKSDDFFTLRGITYYYNDPNLFHHLRTNNITPDTLNSLKSAKDDIKIKYKEYHLTHFKCNGCNNIVTEEFLINKNPYYCKNCEDLKNEFYKKYNTKDNNPEKQKRTKMERYGYTGYMQTDEFKEKTKTTFLKKYNTENYMQTDEFKEKTKTTFLKKYNTENYMQTDEFKEKAKETKLEKYGVDNVFKSEVFREQIKQTNLEKYGSIHPSQSDIIKDKIKQTNLENYGVDCVFGADIIRTQIRNTMLEKYGVEYPMQSEEIKEKIKQTTLERYGVECIFSSDEYKEQIKQSNLEKYGYEYPSQSEEIKEKTKQSNLEKYGYEYPSQAEFFKEKIKQTNLEKYGYEHVFQVPEIREQIKQTCLEKYGVEHPAQLEETKEKIKQTNLEKYGVEYNFQAPEIREQIKQTCLEKYGYEHTLQVPEIKEKIKQIILERYGVKHFSQMHIKNYESYNEEYIRENFIKDGYFLKDEFMEYFDVSYNTIFDVKNKFNITEPNKTEKHKTQNYIFDSIKTDNKLLNDRSLGFELDIYIPDYKLAVEYNGLLYHSRGISNHSMFNTPNFDSNYHLNKTLECKKNGITLFHIFEGEDIDLWLSMINNKLGLNNKIFARKCIIKELNYNEVKDFLDNNHLQKSCFSKINIGLFYNNELIQVMTFSKPRFNKNYEYELIRLCSLKNTNVVGGASKLLSYFIKKYKPKNIISYANRRFSNGTIYEKLGFTLIGTSNPNYFYFKTGSLDLESRNKYQKHKLSKLLDNYNPNLSEQQNMFNNNYRRIFDCGNLVYEMKFG